MERREEEKNAEEREESVVRPRRQDGKKDKGSKERDKGSASPSPVPMDDVVISTELGKMFKKLERLEASLKKNEEARSQDKKDILKGQQEIKEARLKDKEEILQSYKNLGDKFNDFTKQVSANFESIDKNFVAIEKDMKLMQTDMKGLHGEQIGLKQQVEVQGGKIDMVEEQIRKQNIIIRKMSEKSPDNLKVRIISWLNDLNMGKVFVNEDIVSAFRVGSKKRQQQMVQRNVLVKFSNLGDKLRVMAFLKQLGTAALKIEGNDVEVYNDIAVDERVWRFKMKPVTVILRDHAIVYNWRFPQQLRFFYGKRMHVIRSNMDAMGYLKTIGLSKTGNGQQTSPVEGAISGSKAKGAEGGKEVAAAVILSESGESSEEE